MHIIQFFPVALMQSNEKSQVFISKMDNSQIKKWRFLAVFLFQLLALPSLCKAYNIAPDAKVTTSTSLDSSFEGKRATDGVIGVEGRGEWACEGVTTSWGDIRYPWIQLDWEKPRQIDRIILFDRASLIHNIAGGKLQFSDGTEIQVDEIPKDGTGKLLRFPAKKVSWVRFQVTDGTGKDLGFSEIEVYTARSQASDFVSWVDPYIETNRGRYFFFITGSRPFGMVGAAPHTRNKDQNGGGYNYNENEILGFSQIHSWMISGVEVMPTDSQVNPVGGEQAWKSRFSHDDEIVEPGYQRVFLQNYKTWVELTATERVSFYRFTYTRKTSAQILTNLGGYLCTSTMANAEVKKLNTDGFEGSLSSVKRFWGGPKDVKIFFVVKFDRNFDSLEGWEGKMIQKNVDRIKGDSAGVTARFNVDAGEQIQMKIAISYTSVENARRNLEAECSTWDFVKVKNESRAIWNEWLGKIDVRGKDDNQKIKFYTDLWHVLLGRQKTNDVNGDYPDRTTGKRDGNFTEAIFKIKTLPKGKDGKPLFNMYNSDAFWLSQWNLNVLWGLAWPEVQDDISASLIQYADNGGLLPRGPSGGGYSYIMTSCPATNLIVSTFMKGLLKKTDSIHAFETIKRNHLPGGMLGSKTEIAFYTKHGWWPDNAGITIEAAFQDWGIAQMAKRLQRSKDFKFFSRRAEGWKKCFDPNLKLLLPKNEKGQFAHHDALSGAGWVEANAWQGTFGLSHDIPGLAKLMGGDDTLCSMLNYAFEKAAASKFVFDYTSGYVSYANQPGCSNAHVFSYAKSPWLTQYWVRQVQDKAYGGITPDEGYGGHDEDQGQMGGVSALMALGLFNIQGNEAELPCYEITSPVFDSITISLNKKYYAGNEFVIRTYNNSKENCYIQKAMLNGVELNTFWFTHNEFAKGGKLEIWLGKEPNKHWGISTLPRTE